MKYGLLPASYEFENSHLIPMIDARGSFEGLAENNSLLIVVTIQNKTFAFIPDNQVEAEQIFQAYSNPVFQQSMGITGQVNIQSDVISSDSPLLAETPHRLALKDPDTYRVEIPNEDTETAGHVEINMESAETTSCRSALRQVASFLSSTPEAALLSVGLGSLVHRATEGHFSQTARWSIASLVVLLGTLSGTWFMRNFYGKNLTVDAVDRMTEEQIQSVWQKVGGNVLCTLWAAYEAADGAIAGISLFTGEKATIAAVATATAKFAKTMAIERPRVMHEQGRSSSFVYNISRGLQELAPPMVMGLHTKAVLDLLKIFMPKLAAYGLGVSAPLGLIAALTFGQAGAYITTYYDGAEGGKHQGRMNKGEWSAAHASAEKSPSLLGTSLSLFQTGDALPQVIRTAVAKLGGDSVKQEKFVNWILTALQSVGLGALYANATLEFFKLNFPKVLASESASYVEAGVSVAMMLSAFCVARGKIPTAMQNEKEMDPAFHPELIFERSVRSLFECGCCSQEEQDRLEQGLLAGNGGRSEEYGNSATNVI